MHPIHKKLNRTYNSIRRQAANGATFRSQQLLRSVDRYDELRREALEAGVWDEYCKEKGNDVSHTGYDVSC